MIFLFHFWFSLFVFGSFITFYNDWKVSFQCLFPVVCIKKWLLLLCFRAECIVYASTFLHLNKRYIFDITHSRMLTRWQIFFRFSSHLACVLKWSFIIVNRIKVYQVELSLALKITRMQLYFHSLLVRTIESRH